VRPGEGSRSSARNGPTGRFQGVHLHQAARPVDLDIDTPRSPLSTETETCSIKSLAIFFLSTGVVVAAWPHRRQVRRQRPDRPLVVGREPPGGSIAANVRTRVPLASGASGTLPNDAPTRDPRVDSPARAPGTASPTARPRKLARTSRSRHCRDKSDRSRSTSATADKLASKAARGDGRQDLIADEPIQEGTREALTLGLGIVA